MKDLFDYTVPSFEELYAGLWFGMLLGATLAVGLLFLVMAI